MQRRRRPFHYSGTNVRSVVSEPIEQPGADDPYTNLKEPRRRDLRKELRSFGELARLATSGKRLLRDGARGNSELVVVYPGFGVGDSATALFRAYLSNRGFSVRGWRLGRNHGDVEKLLPQVIARLEHEIKFHRYPVPEAEAEAEGNEAKEVSDTPSSSDPETIKARLVGWSLGGYIAREVARDRPDLVEQVITFGTPVVGGPKYTVSAAKYRQRGDDVDAIEAMVAERNLRPLTVPVTAIFSKSDGVMDWRACIDHFNDDVEHIEIDSPHSGMIVNADVFDLVARRLSPRSPATSTSPTTAESAGSAELSDQDDEAENHDGPEQSGEEE